MLECWFLALLPRCFSSRVKLHKDTHLKKTTVAASKEARHAFSPQWEATNPLLHSSSSGPLCICTVALLLLLEVNKLIRCRIDPLAKSTASVAINYFEEVLNFATCC